MRNPSNANRYEQKIPKKLREQKISSLVEVKWTASSPEPVAAPALSCVSVSVAVATYHLGLCAVPPDTPAHVYTQRPLHEAGQQNIVTSVREDQIKRPNRLCYELFNKYCHLAESSSIKSSLLLIRSLNQKCCPDRMTWNDTVIKSNEMWKGKERRQ